MTTLNKKYKLVAIELPPPPFNLLTEIKDSISYIKYMSKNFYHKLRYGYTLRDTTHLCRATTEYMLPRLIYNRNNFHVWPARFKRDEWIRGLDEIILALQLCQRRTVTSIEFKQMNEGLLTLSKYFMYL